MNIKNLVIFCILNIIHIISCLIALYVFGLKRSMEATIPKEYWLFVYVGSISISFILINLGAFFMGFYDDDYTLMKKENRKNQRKKHKK